MALETLTEKDFSNREKTLDLLRKRVEGLRKGNKQNVAIIGSKNTGKTSLLVKYFYDIIGSGDVVPVYLELREEPFPLLEKRFLNSLLNYFKVKYGEDFDEAFPRSHPEFLSRIAYFEHPSRRSQEHALSSLFGLLSALQEETGLPVVFMLDEFQKLSSFRIKNPYAMLGEKIMTQKEVMYLVSSSTVKRARDIIDNDLSLLFGNFEVHAMGALSPQEAFLFAKKHLGSLNMPSDLLSFMLNLTDYNPFYMENIIGNIKRLACLAGTNEASDKFLCRAVADQLHNPSAPLYQFFFSAVSRVLDFRSAQDFEILLAVSEGCKKSSLIAKTVSKSSSQTTRKLEKFINADILIRHGQIYDYPESLLKLWVNSVYKKRCSSFMPVQDEKSKKETEGKVRDLFYSFMFFHGMDVGERIRRLFMLFGNEAVELAGRSLKLPKFANVSQKRMAGSCIPVFAEAGKKNFWVLDYAEGPVTEAGIYKFLGKIEGLPMPSVRIFLCLNGIETDAKLLAKEKEIWLWTIQDLNVLFGIYEQPGIMLKEKQNG
jgi:uncharacterized protein